MLWVLESVVPYSVYIAMFVLSMTYFCLVFCMFSRGVGKDGRN